MTAASLNTQAEPVREFEPQPPLESLEAEHLTDNERAELLKCINEVRSGRKVYLVRVTNQKVSQGRPRVPHVDFVPDPALAVNAHEGMMTRALVNQKGVPYFYLKDGARAPEDEPYGHTNISAAGILSFRVLREFPGPLAKPEPSPAQAPQATPPNPQAVMAQILAAQAQAMMSMAVAMQAQAMQMWQAAQNTTS